MTASQHEEVQVHEALINAVSIAFSGRSTKLRFDDYLSDPITLENSISQGDPMSMIVYLFYNADILDLPRNKNEFVVAYVDDAALFVEGPSFDETHVTLKRMVNR